MKSCIFAVCLLLALSTPLRAIEYDIDFDKIKLIFLGVLEGVTADTHMDSVVPCIKDTASIGTKIEEAIKDFEVKDISDVKDGIKLIGEAISALPDAMTQCKAAEADIARLVQMLKTFKSPMSFVYHVGKDLIVNGIQIFKDIEGAINSYKVGEWEVFGKDIGDALAKILIGMRNSENFYLHYEAVTEEEFITHHLGLTITDLNDVPKAPITNELSALPDAFDAREKWPECIHEIRNQDHCGSCWAFAGSEVLSDRLCIASQGKIQVTLSPQYLVSCDKGDHGCHGGQLDNEWKFMESTGTVADECFPYTSGANGTEPACISKCADGSAVKLYKAKAGSTKHFTTIDQIKTEIMTNGPVETGFMVYDDFPKYTGGVYIGKSWKLLGGHAVKILGWGKENGVDYWLCANSWGPTWGEKGFFRIKMGNCQIDKNVVSGLADATTYTVEKFLAY